MLESGSWSAGVGVRELECGSWSAGVGVRELECGSWSAGVGAREQVELHGKTGRTDY